MDLSDEIRQIVVLEAYQAPLGIMAILQTADMKRVSIGDTLQAGDVYYRITGIIVTGIKAAEDSRKGIFHCRIEQISDPAI